ncbi:hypothetical protein ONE63_003978 [Megalurothrips usitatus]|uniref:Zinc finger CCHC domain-containing protein 7 n=1 Tax=Megalurothrips usitatus TaxID=439358 RepID=A0AAV7X8Z6_9NEOP|nr:hypothetical protein ONE63_003978 [Megalurothrips usitatus]KAJ1520898.1 hypothetical protein ONE63_003978 [Megalurothrips usitatus]
MDLAKEDASLFYEDRRIESNSPGNQDDSEDEDRQQELEEMLYSQIHYDDSVINNTSIEDKGLPVGNVNVKPSTPSNQSSKFGHSSSGRQGSSPGLKLPTGCTPSQFNHPGRTKASRYYDVNQDVKNADPIFVAPQIPSQTRNTRSNRTSAQQRSGVEASIIRAGGCHPISPVNQTILRKENKNQNDSSGGVNLNVSSPKPHSIDAAVTSDAPGREKSDVSEKDEADPPTSSSSLSPVLSTESQSGTPERKVADTKTPNKSNQRQLPSPSTKNKQHSIEAKMSKVLSSMLDDESRSSLEESQVASMCPTQDLNTESGWSVGMSWADMSSRFSFGVDSIEEESVSSLQLHDSTPAESRTNTPDLQASHEEKDKEEEEESRYQKQLKTKSTIKDDEQNKSESDSESEVGSVVEVAPPVRATPPLVDISDGEYVPTIEQKKVKAKTSKDDIVVLFSKQRSGRRQSGRSKKQPDYVVESSSDDDVVILDEPLLPTPRTETPTKVPSKRSCPAEGNSKIPQKRLSHGQDKNNSAITTDRVKEMNDLAQDFVISKEEKELLQRGKELLESPLLEASHRKGTEELDRWLYDPIKSTRSLGHEKMLKNMSSHPDLWKLCPDDLFLKRKSVHGPKCSNCNTFGHKPRLCPEPKKVAVCHMCGNPGHPETRCFMKMCLRCGEKNGVFTDRCNSCISHNPCKICQCRDHGWKMCPDLWRRYHLTTSDGKIVEPVGDDKRPKHEHWCSNCAGRGHLSHECRKAQWKCQSITPYIRSYATASDEEAKVEQPHEMSMLLSDRGAALLSSNEGKTFLQSLSERSNVPILPNLDGTFKTLAIQGVSLRLDEVRQHIINWIKQEEKKLLKDHLTQEASVLLDPWELPKPLSNDLDEVADVVGRQLNVLDSPLSFDMTVKEIHELFKNAGPPNKITKKKRLCRVLNLILLGKCGFKDGAKHVKALRSLAVTIRERKGGTRKELLDKVRKHFKPLFSGQIRHDYVELIQKFYANAVFVEKFDKQQNNSQVIVQPNSLVGEPDSNEDSELNLCMSSSPSVVSDAMLHKVPEDLRKKNIAKAVKANLLDEEYCKARKIAPVVLKNLSSRFIYSYNQNQLSKIYGELRTKNLSKEKRRQCIRRITMLCKKLSKQYNINLSL